jgi:hypothetical protein
VYDSTRGPTLDLVTNSGGTETTQTTGLLGFNAGGFDVGTLAKLNTSGATYVAWMFKKGVTPGFDVVTYTGTGATRTVPHGLGAKPSLIMVKSRTGGQSWDIYHAALGATQYVKLDETAAATVHAAAWDNTEPTASNFTVSTFVGNNGSGASLIAYLFAEVPGFSKFGSYTGNGNADGPFVYTGFKPRWILLKIATGTTSGWVILDSERDAYNPSSARMMANENSAESSGTHLVDFLANGFKLRNSNDAGNRNGSSYIYAAFAEQPFKFANAR